MSQPPPPRVLAAIAEAAAASNRYPDLSVNGLTVRLADEFGIDPARIAVGCGSVSLCQQLVAITCREPDDEVVYAWRSFESYPIVTQIQGATKRTVPLDAQFRHDLDAMAAAVTPRTRLVFVCTPNNPTGTAVRRDEFERFLAAVGPDVLVALDEAYREFVTDPDAVDGATLLDAHPNLVVLRTFSKAYRLAGLRVGYSLGTPEVAQALRKVGSPFAVSSVAQAAAIAALDCRAELLAACAEVEGERERVRAALLHAGYDRAAVAGQLRLHGARREDGGVRGPLPRPEGGRASVARRGRARHGLDAGGERRPTGRGAVVPEVGRQSRYASSAYPPPRTVRIRSGPILRRR